MQTRSRAPSSLAGLFAGPAPPVSDFDFDPSWFGKGAAPSAADQPPDRLVGTRRGLVDIELVPESLLPGARMVPLVRPVDDDDDEDDAENGDVPPVPGELAAVALEEKFSDNVKQSPIERLTSMRKHFLKDEAVDKALADGKVAASANRPHPHRKSWEEATNNDSNFRWIMAKGHLRGGLYPENTTEARTKRVARLLDELTRHRDVVLYECWQVTGGLRDLDDIDRMPDVWLTSPVAQSLPTYVPPRVMDDYVADIDADIADKEERKEAAPAPAKVLRPKTVRSAVVRKASGTLMGIMARYLDEAGLNEKEYSFIKANTDTSMLYKFVIFHIDGFYSELNLPQTLANITELRNFVLFSVYNPFKSSATKWFQSVKTRVTQFYIQPVWNEKSMNPEAFRTDQCIVWYVFLVRTPSAKRYQDERLTNASLLKAKQHAYRVYYPQVYEQLQQLIVPDGKGEIDLYNLVIYVQACTGFRLNEVFRPFIELEPADKRLQNIDNARWIKQIGTSKAKEARGDQYFTDDPAVRRWVIKPLAFMARSDRIMAAVEAIRRVAKQKFEEKHAKDGRKYEEATPKELTIMFGQNVNRRMLKAFPDQAAFAASKGIQFGSHWNRSLYANVAYDQFQDTLGHVSKIGFIADVLMHAQGNLDTAQRYSNMIVSWQLPQNLAPDMVKNLQQFKAFSDWAAEKIGNLEGVVKRASEVGSLTGTPFDAVSGLVNIKDRDGRLVSLERLKHRRTTDPEKRKEFVSEANEILEANNIAPTTANFVALGVSAGFVTMWRKAYGAKLEEDDDEVRRGVIEKSDANIFVTHVVQFSINPYAYMKKKWLNFHQLPLEEFLQGPPELLTLPQLLDTERPPTNRENFDRAVWDVMHFFNREERLQLLVDTNGMAWQGMQGDEKEDEVSDAIRATVRDREHPPSPFRLALSVYMARDGDPRSTPFVYHLLYLYGPDMPQPDLLAGAKVLKADDDFLSRPFTVNPKTLLDMESGLSADEMKLLDVKEISAVDLTRVAGMLERGDKIADERDFKIAALIRNREQLLIKQGKENEKLRRKRARLGAIGPAAVAEAEAKEKKHVKAVSSVAQAALEELETHIGAPVKIVKWTGEDYVESTKPFGPGGKSALSSKVARRNNTQFERFKRPMIDEKDCAPMKDADGNVTDVIRVDVTQKGAYKQPNELKLCVEVDQGQKTLAQRKTALKATETKLKSDKSGWEVQAPNEKDPWPSVPNPDVQMYS